MTLGEKIKQYRKRSNKSQFELEMEIGISPGSISRFENGEINPTKESLYKISKVLNLTSHEIASLFDIKINDKTIALAKASKLLHSSLKVEDVLQNSVDEIVYQLDLLAAYITILRQDVLYGETSTKNIISQVAKKLFPQDIKKLNIKLDPQSSNLMVKTVLNKRSYYRERLIEFMVPVVSLPIALIIEKATGVKSSISFPIIINNKCIGAICFAKNHVNNFSEEYDILKYFTENIGISLNNAKQYQQLLK